MEQITQNTTITAEVDSLQEIDKLFTETGYPKSDNKGGSYEISSLMMYLTGIEKKRFDEHIPRLTKQYAAYDTNASAHIIRDLCTVRTSLMQHSKDITRRLYYDVNTLATIPEYVPHEPVLDLEQAGITFPGGKPDICNYVMKINDEICRRINEVRCLFPEWLKWDYVRALFIMPGGSKKDKVDAAVSSFKANKKRYPFQVWINWKHDGYGNIFKDDYKFVTSLYYVNGDVFEDLSLITATKDSMLVNLHDFIDQHRKVLIAVDCENSDPIKMAAALLSLEERQLLSIYEIILFDSDSTTPAWDTLCGTEVMKELSSSHIIVDKLYSYKSQVDMDLALKVTREVLGNGVDAVILATSDSDYWTLIRNTPESDFLVMLEKMKSGNTIRDTLKNGGYQYCFLDDFCTSRAYTIKIDTILESLQRELDGIVDFNIKEMLQEQAKTSWLALTDKEGENLFDKYLKTMKLKIAPDGTVRLSIKE